MSEKLKDLLSFGNSKVGADTAIFNMNAAFDCPSEKLGLCPHAKSCYAKKAERIYPQTLPYRRKQEIYWDSTDVDTFVAEFLVAIKNKKKTPIKFLRISESGDFKSQEDLEKLNLIAEKLKGIVVVYTYTARKDLNYDNLSENLIVNGSGFMVSNNFYVINKVGDEFDKFVCPGACLTCNLCKKSRNRNIAVLKH
jgi:hypothetical protein